MGYGVSSDGIPFWKVKNSWSDSWGDQVRSLYICVLIRVPGGMGASVPLPTTHPVR